MTTLEKMQEAALAVDRERFDALAEDLFDEMSEGRTWLLSPMVPVEAPCTCARPTPDESEER
jgi:hypothetical protein